MNHSNIAAIHALRVPQGQEENAKALTEVIAAAHGLKVHNYVNLSIVLTPQDKRVPKYNQGLFTLLSSDDEPIQRFIPARNSTYLGLVSGDCRATPDIVIRLGLKRDDPTTLLSETRNTRHAPYDPQNFAHLVRERMHTKLEGQWAGIFAVAAPHPVLCLSANGRSLYACAYMYEGVVLVLYSNFMPNMEQDRAVKTYGIALKHREDTGMFLLLQGKYLFTKANSWSAKVARTPYELCFTAERFIQRNIL